MNQIPTVQKGSSKCWWAILLFCVFTTVIAYYISGGSVLTTLATALGTFAWLTAK